LSKPELSGRWFLLVTQLKRSAVNPEGVASQDALKVVRVNLQELGLITEDIEEGPIARTYLTVTEKGRRVAQKIREIQEILEE
jgi:hypothetical protein